MAKDKKIFVVNQISGGVLYSTSVFGGSAEIINVDWDNLKSGHCDDIDGLIKDLEPVKNLATVKKILDNLQEMKKEIVKKQ